jgi:hypothetical protein
MAGALAVAIIGAWGPSAMALPSIDDLLGAAREGHPDMLAVKAKVAAVQAELAKAELEVTRQLTALHTDYSAQEQAVEKARQKNEEAQGALEKLKSGGNLGDLSNAETQAKAAKAALDEAEAKLAKANADLEQMIGAFNRAAGRAEKPAAQEPEPQMPSDASVQKVLVTLQKPVDVEFADVAVPEAVKMMRDAQKLPISHDAARDLGEIKVTVSLKETKLGAALQAIEDQNADIVFVVREYGILVTRKDYAKERGFVSAVQLWRDKAGDLPDPKPEEKPAEAPKDAPKDAPAPAPAAATP